MSPVTLDEVRSWLRYEPETGLLSWAVKRGCCAAGTPITCKDSHGYIVVRLNKRLYRAHRVIWFLVTGAWPSGDIDHIDHDRANNRWSNIRDVSRAVNIQNSGSAPHRESTSGIRGAHYVARYRKFESEIRANGRRHFLGYFDKAEDAAAAYEAAKRRLHGNAQGVLA